MKILLTYLRLLNLWGTIVFFIIAYYTESMGSSLKNSLPPPPVNRYIWLCLSWIPSTLINSWQIMSNKCLLNKWMFTRKAPSCCLTLILKDFVVQQRPWKYISKENNIKENTYFSKQNVTYQNQWWKIRLCLFFQALQKLWYLILQKKSTLVQFDRCKN